MSAVAFRVRRWRWNLLRYQRNSFRNDPCRSLSMAPMHGAQGGSATQGAQTRRALQAVDAPDPRAQDAAQRARRDRHSVHLLTRSSPAILFDSNWNLQQNIRLWKTGIEQPLRTFAEYPHRDNLVSIPSASIDRKYRTRCTGSTASRTRDFYTRGHGGIPFVISTSSEHACVPTPLLSTATQWKLAQERTQTPARPPS